MLYCAGNGQELLIIYICIAQTSISIYSVALHIIVKVKLCQNN